MRTSIIAILLLIIPLPAMAHGGGLDRTGCHHDRKAGGYHCHRGPLAGQSFKTKQEASEKLLPKPDPSDKSSIVGRATVTDGDSIKVAGKRIRLFGIDAPEADQQCEVNGRQTPCGQNATFALANIVGRHWVYCRQIDTDRYRRVVAVCNLAGPEGPEINAAMVRQGWALAYRRFSMDYVRHEEEASAAKIGIWRGEFVAPWDWRSGKGLDDAAGHTRDTERSDRQQQADCRIKGNISRSGEHIYHVPGGQYYRRTRISAAKGERWFCNEAEARAAGWRRSKR